MFAAWIKLSVDAARLYQETQQVIGLRLIKLARGGPASGVEAHRMVTEKGFAFAEAAASLAVGMSAEKVIRRYRSHVRSNKRRLSNR